MINLLLMCDFQKKKKRWWVC